MELSETLVNESTSPSRSWRTCGDKASSRVETGTGESFDATVSVIGLAARDSVRPSKAMVPLGHFDKLFRNMHTRGTLTLEMAPFCVEATMAERWWSRFNFEKDEVGRVFCGRVATVMIIVAVLDAADKFTHPSSNACCSRVLSESGVVKVAIKGDKRPETSSTDHAFGVEVNPVKIFAASNCCCGEEAEFGSRNEATSSNCAVT